MKVTEKYGMFFVGKKLLVERMLKLLKKREKAFNEAFKAQRKAGKLTSQSETGTYMVMVDLIRFVEGAVREERERVRLYELPHDEQIFEIYGEYPRVMTPEEAEKHKAVVADAHLRWVLLNAKFAAKLSAEGSEN